MRATETETRGAPPLEAEASSTGRALRRLTVHEALATLALAPLFLFPTPATVAVGCAGLVTLRAAVWRATGCALPAGVPALPVLWLLAMGALGLAISIDPAVSLPRFAGLVFGAGVYCAAAGHARRVTADEGALAADPLPGTLVALGGGVAVTMPFLVNWAEKAPPWLPPGVYTAWPLLFPHLLRDSLGRTLDGLGVNAVAGLLAMLLPLALALATRPAPTRHLPPLWDRALPWTAGAIALSLLATESRGGLLAGGVGGAAYLGWRYRRLTLPLAGAALLVLLAGLLPLLRAVTTPSALVAAVPLALQQDTVLFRLALWERALAMIADHPFTGVGLNNFPLLQARLYPLFPSQPAALVVHAHNLYLQAALDYGIPGLLALLALGAALITAIAPGLRRAAGDAPTLRAVLLAGCCAGLLAFAVHGLIDALAVGSRPALLAWLLAGLAAGYAPPPAGRRLSPALATLLWATAALVVGTGLAVALG